MKEDTWHQSLVSTHMCMYMHPHMCTCMHEWGEREKKNIFKKSFDKRVNVWKSATIYFLLVIKWISNVLCYLNHSLLLSATEWLQKAKEVATEFKETYLRVRHRRLIGQPRGCPGKRALSQIVEVLLETSLHHEATGTQASAKSQVLVEVQR